MFSVSYDTNFSTLLSYCVKVRVKVKLQQTTNVQTGNRRIASGSPRNFLVGGLHQKFFSGGVQQIQLRTEGIEKGDQGAVAP
jgi:hypothetical protein